ncbi:MAG: hypothetical protein IJ630_06290 [Treponema sp.]|nr:hypothetical protein [Treponema sp.]
MFRRLFFSASIFLAGTLFFSQEALKSTEEEYYDFLSLSGITERPTLGYRTLSDSEWSFALDEEGNSLEDSDGNIWKNNNLGKKRRLWQSENEGNNWFTRGFDHSLKLKIYGPEWYNSYNTAAPYGQNDGALWQGKGYNTSLTGGVRLEGYGFEVTVKPQVSYSQNKDFDLMTSVVSSPYGYYQRGIDLPQRFGDSSFWTYDWGDTEIRYTWQSLTLGAGTQSPWLGPAWLNPMLGSNNAATYPKLDAGLRKTSVYLPYFGWYIGDIEGRVWLGKLTESDYFDDNTSNDYRLLTAMSASFAPSFIPGLTVGVNRVFITDWAAHNLKYIGRLFTLSKSNGSQVGTHEDEDQKVALFADWQFSNVGFEVYGELGIDDFTSDQLSNPFHTAIYTIGAKQSIPIAETIQKYTGKLKSELLFEWNNFEMSQDFQLQWQYTGYYSHGSIMQGYTQKGQILGAGSGYFGNSQFLGYKIYHSHGSVMLFFHRFCPDNNYIYNMAVNADASYGSTINKDYYAVYKTVRSYGISVTQFFSSSFFINANLTRSFTGHKVYTQASDAGFHFGLTVKYNL